MRGGLGLLSRNDLRELQRALNAGQEIQLPRAWADGSGRVLASTVPADPAWAPAKMLLRIETWSGNTYSSQYFASVAELTELGRKAATP